MVKLIEPEHIHFSIWDYAVFIGALVLSMAIGIYHAFKGNKTTSDFLMASRSMSPIPVAMSITATYLSSIAILGFSGEVYGNGIQLVGMALGNVFGVLLAMYTSIPLMYSLKFTSVNEYMELRFNSVTLRKVVAALNCAPSIMYLGICLYAPTLALDAVTPLSLWVYIPLLGTIVTLYSAVGGLKAVVWTDVFQTVIMFGGILITTASAIVFVGGFENVWNIGTQYGRTTVFDFRVGVYVRHTFINTVMLGFIGFFNGMGFNQSYLQRVSTMPNLKKVRLVLWLNLIGLTTLICLLFLCGLAVFAVYAGCDPLTLGLVERKDQILAYYVMDYLGSFSGLPGLFVACLFCGTLSSISSALNGTVAMIWVDFMSEIPFFKNISEEGKTLTNKIMTLILGCVMIAIAYLATTFGGILQANISMQGALNGPVLGTYLLGMMVPQCTKKGAFIGTITSILMMIWLTTGSLFKGMKTAMLPRSTDECNETDWQFVLTEGSGTNLTSLQYNVTAQPDDEYPHFFYGISYTYYSFVGAAACVIVGCIVTLLTGKEDVDELDPALVFSCLRKYVGKNRKKTQKMKKEKNVIESTAF